MANNNLIGEDSYYEQKGITAISNDNAVVPRDQSGNVIIYLTSSLLIVEAIEKNILAESVLPTLDTQFNYFKFPVRTTIVDEQLDLDLDLDFDLSANSQDPIFARYKPSENRTINANATPAGILMDDVVEGMMQRKTNSYYITKEIKNSGADLRFRIVIVHRYDSDITNDPSTAFFTLMKTTVATGIDREYKRYQTSNGGVITQYQVQKLVIDEIIPNEELEIGDLFNIGAVCGVDEEFRYHTINSDTSYWVITDASKNVDEWNQEIS
jgi:hypothetical protein